MTAGAGERARSPRSPLMLALLGLCAAIGVAGLTALGIWQLERRVWKLDLIAKVDQRVHAVPAPAPGPSAWPAVNSNDDEYRRVTVAGHYLNNRETLVQAVTERGSGFWVLTPLKTDAGFTVLVNRGFVPPDKREAAARAEGQLFRKTTVTGLMRMTEPGGAFLRANDAAADRWYSRDVAAISAARSLSGVAPYFIDADATPNPGGFPIGGLTVVAFRNTHLIYAATWFALALMLAVLAFRIGLEELRVRREHQGSRGD